jgi:nucleotide-binding universal stress UspA family protein
MGYKHIALATDFSANADLAFASAIVLARQHGAKLSLVHVIPPLVTPSPLLDDMMVSEVSLRLGENLDQAARQEMQNRYLVQCKGVEARSVVIDGDPTRELLQFCIDEQVDLLVVGSTGATGLAGAIFGSVASRVVRRAPCSVMVVRPCAIS